MYSMYIQDVLFPVTPGKITYKIGNNNKTITLINEGEINLIKTPGLTEITIDELLLPVYQEYPFSQYEHGFETAAYYLDYLEKWKKSKKPISFKLIKPEPVGTKRDPYSFDFTKFSKQVRVGSPGTLYKYVTIEDYEIIEDADEYGMDIAVKLTMKEYRQWGIKKLAVRKGQTLKQVAVKKNTRKTKSTAKTYKVRKGDTLLNIAKKQLGNSSRRKEIYKLNKKKIEQAAKKHGRKSSSNGLYLYKGTVLKLPK